MSAGASRTDVSPPIESLAASSEGKQNATRERLVPGQNLAHVEAPADITATELFDVATETLRRCDMWPNPAELGAWTRARSLGILATFVHVMRERGWVVLPPR